MQFLVHLQPGATRGLLNSAISQHGGHVLHYVPHHAFLVIAARETLPHIRSLPGPKTIQKESKFIFLDTIYWYTLRELLCVIFFA